MDKTIRRVTDPDEQQAESYRYWQSLSVGERLSAVWDASEAAYAFAAVSKECRCTRRPCPAGMETRQLTLNRAVSPLPRRHPKSSSPR
jgi:hypothetical protein